jgi:hypothetical protein
VKRTLTIEQNGITNDKKLKKDIEESKNRELNDIMREI